MSSDITAQLKDSDLELIAEDNGMRLWDAEKLSQFLGYASYESFKRVIRKARVSSEQLGLDTDEEFIQKKDNGKKGYKLTRFACLLCTLHADASKPKVAEAKVHLAKFADFAFQANELDRIDERKKLSHGENYMASVAKNHGLPQEKFGLFKSGGYRGMYNMNLNELKKYKGVKDSGTLYDFMGITELAANTFRVTQTAESIKRRDAHHSDEMIEIAHEVGKEVRRIVKDNTGEYPEDIKIESKITEKIKKTRKVMSDHDKK